jgi:arginine kinase
MQQGADIAKVFDRLCRACRAINEFVEFSRDDHLGFITSCPTNLGTGLRASVHIKLANLARQKDLMESIAEKYEL